MRKYAIVSFVAVIFILIGVLIYNLTQSEETYEEDMTNTLTAMVMNMDDDLLTVQGSDNVIYTFKLSDDSLAVGDFVELEYMGDLDSNEVLQNNEVVSYSVVEMEDGIPKDFLDNGIFKDYYELAYKKLKTMTLDEKISQILLVRYPDNNQVDTLKNYQFGGYVFYAKDFQDKNSNQVKTMMNNLQEVSKIPILTATDEEGGKVVRVSSNPKLASTPFKSSKELYASGGFEAIREDTVNKSRLLYNLGIHVNLAPVVDVTTNPSDYMYDRALGQDTDVTSEFAKTVIKASKGLGVSYTLKHFPGYGNNSDTHNGASIDERTLEDIKKNDLPPFKAGIDEGAEAVLVSHNTVNSIDPDNPASLSIKVHNLLRGELGFTGIIMTDDLAMGATKDISDAPLKAILAGNDLIITTDYDESINSIKKALDNKTIDESLIDKLAFRVIAWKYYKGLIFENQK